MKQEVWHALVIDDDSQVSSLVANVLSQDGWSVSEAASAEQSFEMLPERRWNIVFCDVMMGGKDGYAALRHFTENQPEARFVLMTGHASAAGALDATAIGAYDYLIKPFSVDDILKLARSVRRQHQLRSKKTPVKAVEPPAGYTSDIPLIGRSSKFVECLKMFGRVAPTNIPVLITGESGTGKELVAQAIHQRSRRAGGSFVAVNCGAIPVELIESELFGHARGSFTGASSERVGMWEEASGGTILLDEITETGLMFQVKLLRALQQSEIRRVGSNRTIKVDVRVIAATNRNIEDEVREGRFRQDLMYRLNAVTIDIPPLRERREDIPLLADYFARRVRLPPDSPVTFSPDAISTLQDYDWSGNVRELENAVLHAASMCDDVIYPEHLPARVRHFTEAAAARSELSPIADGDQDEWLSLALIEQKYVARVLAHTAGNKQAAARLLNIDRKTLARILKRGETDS